jgi:hypothetical protein
MIDHSAQFPGYDGHWIFVSPFNGGVAKDMFSPMGLAICAIGIHFAYSVPRVRSV